MRFIRALYEMELLSIPMKYLLIISLIFSFFCDASESDLDFQKYLDFVESKKINSPDVFRFLTPHRRSELSVLTKENRILAYKYIYFPRHVNLKHKLSSSTESCLIWEAEHIDLFSLIPTGKTIRISILMVKGVNSWQVDSVGYYPYSEDKAICE